METGVLGKYRETVEQYHCEATHSLKNSSWDQTMLVFPWLQSGSESKNTYHNVLKKVRRWKQRNIFHGHEGSRLHGMDACLVDKQTLELTR
jgi:hypothetical protein